MVVDAVSRGQKVLTHTLLLAFPYTYLERIRLLVAAMNGSILDEEFTADVTMSARMRVENLEEFQSKLSELTNGRIEAEIISTENVLMPLLA